MGCKTSDIERHCGKSIGGIKQIFIIYPSEIFAIPKSYCNGSADGQSVELAYGANYTQIVFKKETALGVSNGNIGNKAGDYVENAVSFFVPRIRKEVNKLIRVLHNQRVTVFTIDNNDTVRLYQKLRFNASTTTGTTYKDKNGTSFNLTGKSIYQPIILDNWFPIPNISGKLILVSPSGNRFLVSVGVTNTNEKYLISEKIAVGNDPHIVLSDANGDNYLWKVSDRGSFATRMVSDNGTPSIDVDGNTVTVNNQGTFQIQ